MRILRPLARQTVFSLVEDWESKTLSEKVQASILTKFTKYVNVDAMLLAVRHGRVDMFVHLFGKCHPIPAQLPSFFVYRNYTQQRYTNNFSTNMEACFKIAAENDNVTMLRLLRPMVGRVLAWFSDATGRGSIRAAKLLYSWGNGERHSLHSTWIMGANDKAAASLQLNSLKLLHKFGKLDTQRVIDVIGQNAFTAEEMRPVIDFICARGVSDFTFATRYGYPPHNDTMRELISVVPLIKLSELIGFFANMYDDNSLVRIVNRFELGKARDAMIARIRKILPRFML